MVLVDTSVWVRFLYGREPYLSGLRKLFDEDRAVGHDLVFGELLIGDSGGRQEVLTDYWGLLRAHMIPHEEVVAFVRQSGLRSRGLGWIDAHLLASALVGKFDLWTADAAFAKAAEALGVAYRLTRP